LADVKISAATDAATLLSTDKVPVARSGSTVAYSATMIEVQAFTNSTPNGTTSTGLTLKSGNASAGNSGTVTVQTGTASGTRGAIILDAPTIGTADQTGATDSNDIDIISGSTVNGNSGTAGVETGAPSGNGNSGNAFIGTADCAGSGQPGRIAMFTGTASGAGVNGGDVHIALGAGGAGGRQGLVVIATLPTADPHVVGALWIDTAAGRVVKSSNG
jgi:hypothetical protein